MKDKEKHRADKKWFIIFTKPKKEILVLNELLNQGVEAKFFQQESLICRKNFYKKVLKPLISNYVFVHIFEKDIYKYQYLPGSVKFLQFNNTFGYLTSSEINFLETLSQYNYQVSLCDKLVDGIKIEITQGIFKGVLGFVRTKSSSKEIYIDCSLQNMAILIRKENLIFRIIES